ncbi:hypothetical protein Tsubulata_013165 [Turnera subulata]|uniref:U2A'/phosphoprotein 32 family A C-terminal domain-containing protein n=1 Tax=Turnera subulata TaxID=218843 RepID=A0A9Q0FW53_9ROSI|nr:hypothetical protein Tsubulata_013165 [Turnera subulata]
MATDISSLQDMYINSCKRHEVLPNTAVLSAFFMSEFKKSCHELCSLEIVLDELKDIDFPPLIDVCAAIEGSEIEAVDIRNDSLSPVDGEYALSLMRAFDQKLRVVDLQDSSFGKDSLRELSRRGLTCQVLNLRCSHFRKLNMAGEFRRIRTLNLDFSASLCSFREDCFACMPNLISLSMCGTRVSNLWTTVAALSKLDALVELRFQKWLCCNDTGSSSATSGGKLDDQPDSSSPQNFTDFGSLSIDTDEYSDFQSGTEQALRNMFSINQHINMMEDSSDDSELDFSSHRQIFDFTELFSDVSPGSNRHGNLQDEVPFGALRTEMEDSIIGSSSKRHSTDVALKYISQYPSSICFEKHYREYMIASLPQLKVLDNLPVRRIDKERAGVTFAQCFEYLPYKRRCKQSVVDILHKREIKESRSLPRKSHEPSYYNGNSQYFYTRSLCSAKVGSSAWPSVHSLSVSGCDLGNGSRGFRPRQFEYHPSISSLMVCGTLDGEVVVINHENEKIVSYVPSLGSMNSVLGLCWLNKYPSKLIAGSDNGSLKLFDIEGMVPPVMGTHGHAKTVTFDDFDQLTSVHVNSSDELFLASGYSKNVALYDINYGRRIQVFTDMHKEHINVVKFSNHSPSIFATSSFDHDVKLWDLRQNPIRPCYTSSSSKGNVMACFSPDDRYLLVSAVDNEVRQLLAVDGRLHLNFDIASTGSPHNYTRSYYMNGRDYIISGSCDERVVRVCCAQTGRRFRDIALEGKGLGTSMYVQSLRGDPFRDFNMSILAAHMRPSSKYEIVKVNLLAACDHTRESSSSSHSSNSMGG